MKIASIAFIFLISSIHFKISFPQKLNTTNPVLMLPQITLNKTTDTLEFDPYHYNRYVGKIIVYLGEGIPYHDQVCSLNPFKKVQSMASYQNTLFNSEFSAYPADNSFMTLIDSVFKKEFLCLGIETDGSSIYLKLQNSKIGVMVTKFVLSSGIDTSPFKTKEELHGGGNHDKKVVTDLIKPKENKKEEFIPCSKIDYEYDEFEYTKKYSTASSYDEQVERPHDPAYYAGEKTETKTIWYNTVFYKNIEKGQPTYYLALEIPSSTPTHNKGVIIILNNGSRINRPLEKVTTRVRETESDEPYMVRSFMRLKQTDISLLKSSPIKEFELFADQAYSVQSEKVYQMFLCLLTKK